MSGPRVSGFVVTRLHGGIKARENVYLNTSLLEFDPPIKGDFVMHFLSGFSLPVVIIDKLQRLLIVSLAAYVALKMAVDGWQDHVATFTSGGASCQ
jgi:hypothetical protein